MVVAIACGGVFGLGLVLVGLGLRPRRLPLHLALAQITATSSPRPDAHGGWLREQVTAPVAHALVKAGLQAGSVRRDLQVCGRTLEAHVGSKVGVGLFGALLIPAMATVMALGGVVMPWAVIVPLSAIFGVAGFLVPDLLIKAHAAELRAEARRALGAFLDLAVIVLAGGAGVQTALERAAGTGGGWAFERIRRALATARATRAAPWAALARLGEELGVQEFQELAASVELAGTEGARVRESLVAKAASLRAHELATAEAKAASATEAMSVPVALLAMGFVIFLAFPAVMAVLNVS